MRVALENRLFQLLDGTPDMVSRVDASAYRPKTWIVMLVKELCL